MSEEKRYKVYTKNGDKGSTSLIGGQRVKKNDPRVDAYGTMDELKSYIGLLHSQSQIEEQKKVLETIMIKLFVAESVVAADSEKSAQKLNHIKNEDIEFLEQQIDTFELELPPLTSFILPAGHEHIAHCHIARTICRRAERKCINLLETSPFILPTVQYLNRLSDYLFVYARWISYKYKVEEIKWL